MGSSLTSIYQKNYTRKIKRLNTQTPLMQQYPQGVLLMQWRGLSFSTHYSVLIYSTKSQRCSSVSGSGF